MANDDFLELRTANADLQRRVVRLERRLFFTVHHAGIIALFIGLLVPFVVQQPDFVDRDDPTRLLSVIVQSFEESRNQEARTIAGIAFLLVVGLIAALAGAIALIASNSPRVPRITSATSVVLLLAFAASWVTVFVVSTAANSSISGFSPATLVLTIGGLLCLAATRLTPDPRPPRP